MLDARGTMPRSSRRTSPNESENECEGRPSLGTGGPPSECTKTSFDDARSPLAAAGNAGGEPPASKLPGKTLTPSKMKPPSAPGLSNSSLSQNSKNVVARVVAASLLPSSRPGSAASGTENADTSRAADAARSPGRTTRSRTAAAATDHRKKGLPRGGARGGGDSERGAAGSSAVASGRSRRLGAAPVGTSRVNTRTAMASAAPSSRRLSHKLSQPIAVSGRMTRTATKVTPRLELSTRGGGANGKGGRGGVGGAGGGGGGGLTPPSETRPKRAAAAGREGFGMPMRRVYKSPRTSLDRADSTPVPSRSRTPIPGPRRDRGGGGGGDGVGGSVRVHSQRIFTINDEEIEQLVKARPNKGTSKWDYKARLQSQSELVAKLRSTLDTMQQQKQLFQDACIDTEAALRAEMRKVNSRCEDVERDHVGLLDENLRFRSLEAGLKADLKLAAEERSVLRAENEKLHAKADALREELNRAQGSALKLEAMVADGQSRTSEAETLLAMAREKLSLAESRAFESLTLKEREWEARIDTATSDALKQVELQRAKLGENDMELEALREDNTVLLQKTADFREELAMANGRAKEAEARLERRLADLERLKEAHERAENALSTKNQEASTTVAAFVTAQTAAQQRENDLKEGLRALDDRLKILDAEKESLSKELFSRDSGMASLTAEINLLKEQLTAASAEASRYRAELVEASMEAKQATKALGGERQSRLRAETREEDERRERISTMANAQAQATEHRQEMEAQRNARSKMEAEFEQRLKTALKEAEAMRLKSVLDGERRLELEAEIRGLKAAVVDAQTNAEQLEEMSRAQGELDVVRHRLETLSREKESVAIDASVRIEELEAKVQEGETQRRKMHNLIQELRGNVRVFARVRPFLPSDDVPDEAKPAVVGKGDGVGCMVSKRVIGDTGKDFGIETQSFAFDKCFPPSAGQEEVFAEVSEFVQSALDGFNVCLFSYGQTGSGKTHTMQGSGAGTMRGIIPRAMEQVGKYKSKLETQGWEYDMQVSFLEIYNEQIRDLLRDESCVKDIKHEIKRDPRGNTTVTDLTMEMVDPNDSAGVDDIMERAACHRSVGRTDMNERSSRSHSVFTLHLKAMNRQQRSTVKGTLHLVDLAGSERLNRSNAKGDRLKETVAINKSLSSLTDVFVSISNKSSHIPFRNSKLTYLLQPALSGDGKTLMMVNLSPTEESYHESLCSLRFAAQVNQCELGRPKRHLRDMGSADGASTSSKGSTSSRKGSGRT
ncbi:unnamed protein product [Ascophyllum nodosum]